MGDQEVVCRICLKISDGSNIIDEVISERFGVLLIKMDFCISTNPIICENCTEKVLSCYNFKLACLSTEELVAASVDNSGEQLSQRDVCLTDNKNDGEENYELCHFCKKCANRNDMKSLEALNEELLNKDMFLKYIPEMDFSVIKDSVLCKHCLISLSVYFNFAKNCSETEEKIINYCIIKRKNHIKLYEVVRFISENTQESVCSTENEFVDVSAIKEEDNSSEDLSKSSIYLDKILVKAEQEQFDIKDEENKYKNFNLTQNNICGDPQLESQGNYSTNLINHKRETDEEQEEDSETNIVSNQQTREEFDKKEYDNELSKLRTRQNRKNKGVAKETVKNTQNVLYIQDKIERAREFGRQRARRYRENKRAARETNKYTQNVPEDPDKIERAKQLSRQRSRRYRDNCRQKKGSGQENSIMEESLGDYSTDSVSHKRARDEELEEGSEADIVNDKERREEYDIELAKQRSRQHRENKRAAKEMMKNTQNVRENPDKMERAKELARQRSRRYRENCRKKKESGQVTEHKTKQTMDTKEFSREYSQRHRREAICRICLNISDDGNMIDKVLNDRFVSLLIQIDFCVSKDPVICRNCTEKVLSSYIFKLACLSTEELVFAVSVDNSGEQLRLRDVYLTDNKNDGEENYDLCRFCKKCANRNDMKSFGALKDELSNEDMFLKYVPEMDFSSIKDPVVCKSCLTSLDIYFDFARNCCDTEEKIMKYCVIKRKSHVMLNEVVKFILEDTQESVRCRENEFVDVSAIKKEENSSEDLSNSTIYPDKILVKAEQEQLDIKDEEINYKNCDLTQNNNCDDSLMTQFPRQEEEMLEDPVFYKTEILPDTTYNPNAKYKCEQCVYETKHKPNMARHMLVHAESSKIHKCDICGFSTKYLQYHMLVHEGPSSVKSKNLKQLLFYAEPSGLEIHKCDKCEFSTKYKHNLKGHMLIHEDPANLEIFKCETCNFSTKREKNLKQHLLTHEDPSNLETYRCEKCDFKSKYKHNLKKHMSVHADPLDREIYKCETCAFQTKHKQYFKKHKLGHTQTTHSKTYKCEICGVDVERQEDLEHHMLVHADHSDLKPYKCEVCDFVTKHKQSLKRHMLLHEDSSKVAIPSVDIQNVNYEIKNEEN